MNGSDAAGKNIESFELVVRNRIRMFLRNTWVVTVLGTVMLGLAIWGAVHLTLAPSEFTIAAGPPDSANVKLAQLLAKKFTDERDKVRLKVEVTAGPHDSAAALANGAAALAILPSTIGNSPDWPVVAIIRQNVMALVVPPRPAAAGKEVAAQQPSKPAAKETTKEADNQAAETKDNAAKPNKSAGKSDGKSKTAKTDKGGKGAKATKTAGKSTETSDDADSKDDSAGDTDAGKLNTVAKLAGQRIAIVSGNEATKDLLGTVLGHYGVPLDKVQISFIDPRDIAHAVKHQTIDVLFVAGSPTGAAITEVVTAATQNGQGPTIIPIDQADGIAKRNRAFDSVDIDAGTFGGNPPAPSEDVKGLSFGEYLVAQRSTGHDAIGALAKLIFTSRLALAAAMPGEIKIEAPKTEKDADLVVHPGALAYLTDDQKSFFDRYGDDIFYGLLIFPIFGSAIAGLAGYFRSSGRTMRLRLLQRILDLVRKAHAAPSLAGLDALQADLDALVVSLIHQTEHEEYDEALQTSFSLALDQVRFAIASRRAALLAQPGTAATEGAKADGKAETKADAEAAAA